MTRINVTLRRDRTNSFLYTFMDLDVSPILGDDTDTERHETLINDPEWHVCKYDV